MASFLEALKSRCDVIELDGGRDWRRGVDGTAARDTSWYLAEDASFDKLWSDVGEGEFINV